MSPARPTTTADATEQTAKPRDDERGRTITWVATLIIVASTMLAAFHVQPTSKKNVNTASRFATVTSLVHRGTYAIDKSMYRFTVDKVKIDGRYYSSKPPMIPTYTAGVYYVYHKLTGHAFNKNEREAVFVCTAATGLLSHVITLIYLFKLARRMFRRDLAVLATLLAGAFAYLGTGYATRLNNHTIAAAAVMVGFYYCYRATSEDQPRARDWIFAGLSFGFLPTFDIPSGVISVGAFVYLVTSNWKKTLMYFVPAALPGIALHFWMMESIYGSLLPVQVRKGVNQFAGSYWKRRAGIDALEEPKHVYLFHMLFGHHGLFSMTPIFVLSLVGLIKSALSKQQHRREAALVLFVLLSLTAFYAYWTRNYGGWSVGFRWLIPAMPLLVVFFGAWLDAATLKPWKLVPVALFFAVSAYNVQDAVSGPFQFSRWHNWLEDKPGRNRTDVHTKKGATQSTKSRKLRKKPRSRRRPLRAK